MAMMPYAPATLLRSAKRLMMLTPAITSAMSFRAEICGVTLTELQVHDPEEGFGEGYPPPHDGHLRAQCPVSRRWGEVEGDFTLCFRPYALNPNGFSFRVAARAQVSGTLPVVAPADAIARRAYVNETFAKCTELNKKAVESELKELIFKAFAEDKLWTTDWPAVKLKSLSQKKRKTTLFVAPDTALEHDRRDKRAKRFVPQTTQLSDRFRDSPSYSTPEPDQIRDPVMLSLLPLPYSG